MAKPPSWTGEQAASVYRVLDHPADLWIEVRGAEFKDLCEHALVALYDNLVDLAGVRPRQTRHLDVRGVEPGEALRALLGDALYLFDAEGFVASAVAVHVGVGAEPVQVAADLWGEILDLARHTPVSEIKAVTYHQLEVEPDDTGEWRARVLLDV